MKEYFKRLWGAIINYPNIPRLEMVALAPAPIIDMAVHKDTIFIATAKGVYYLDPENKEFIGVECEDD